MCALDLVKRLYMKNFYESCGATTIQRKGTHTRTQRRLTVAVDKYLEDCNYIC